jgi:predicted RNA binding protein YcfA (HicA-like mRNA interferase family)
MKIPRDVSASVLLKAPARLGYVKTRQKGSHIRLSRVSVETTHHLTIPNHDPIKLGTLRNILKDVAANTKIGIDDIIEFLD